MALNLFPHELILRILSHVNKKSDLKSFRLVSKSSAALGAEFLFAFLYVRPVYGSVSRFRTFCRTHDHLAPLVKKVVMLLGNWENLIWQPFLNELRQREITLNGDQQDLASEILQNHLTEYFNRLKSPEIRKMLLYGFQCLRKLRTIAIEREFIHDDQHDYIGYAHDKMSHLRDDGGHALCRRAESHDLELGDWVYKLCAGWAHVDGYQAFKALLGAAYYSESEIHSWEVGYGVRMARGTLNNKAIWQLSSAVFLSCRVLRLDIYLGPDPRPNMRVFMDDGDFSGALTSALHLEKLEIATDNVMDIPMELVLDPLFVWVNLRELRMTSACFQAQNFQNFLEKHRNTLKVMWFRRCQLISGTWLGTLGLKRWLNEDFLPRAGLNVFHLRALYEPNGFYGGNIVFGSMEGRSRA